MKDNRDAQFIGMIENKNLQDVKVTKLFFLWNFLPPHTVKQNKTKYGGTIMNEIYWEFSLF